jgi:hypothetical protein
MVTRPLVLATALGLATACKPDLTDKLTLVDGPRIVAIRSERTADGGPDAQSMVAEAAPKAEVTLKALLVDPSGTAQSAAIDWAFCNQPKPLAELGTVSPLCLQTQGAWFTDLGVGIQVSGPLPDIACREFGPSVPVAQPGQPAGRPVDPDTTGGYYQPARLWAPQDNLLAIGETRLLCGLAGGSASQNTQYSKQYLPNTNPEIAALVAQASATLFPDGADAGTPNVVHAGDSPSLEVSWAACPLVSDPPGCGDGVCGPDPNDCTGDCPAQPCTGAEEYLNLEISTTTLVIQREGIHVAWYATAGSFEDDSTGRDGSDTTTSSDNVWHAPAQPGTVHLWVVLQDDRGGVGWEGYTIAVQ